MFYDPIQKEVIDYVGGRQDLAAGIVRAIGNAADRFTEDKLRMLRAVRFAATFEFQLDAATAAAILSLRQQISQVSVERIAQELRRMLSHRTRAVGMQRLIDVGLHEAVFGPLFDAALSGNEFGKIRDVLEHLQQPTFEPSLCAVFQLMFDAGATIRRDRSSRIAGACRKLKLSNEETDSICWIAESAWQCQRAEEKPLHVLKPVLADGRAALLLDYLKATAIAVQQPPVDTDFLQDYINRTPQNVLAPQPLIDGADLQSLGITPGPIFKDLLQTIRNEQLDEVLADRAAALARLNSLAESVRAE